MTSRKGLGDNLLQGLSCIMGSCGKGSIVWELLSLGSFFEPGSDSVCYSTRVQPVAAGAPVSGTVPAFKRQLSALLARVYSGN